jgi:hypothetical protein
MFDIHYISGTDSNTFIQHYYPLTRGVQIANVYSDPKTACGQEYIVAVWHIKLKSIQPIK